jgi:protein-disulfide isomerase
VVSEPVVHHAPVKKTTSWWAVATIFLFLILCGILLYNFDNGFRGNVNGAAEKIGLGKLVADKDDTKKTPAQPQEKFQMNLTIVYNKEDANQKETIVTYLNNIENNLQNTRVVPTWLDKNDPQGKDYISKLDAKYLPIFITDDSIQKHPQYALFAPAIKNVNGIQVFQSEGMEYLKIPEIGQARVKGADPKKAKLVIMEYVSMTCGFCKMMNPVINNIATKYGKDVAVVTKHFDRGGIDSLLAQSTECAGDQGKFDKMKDLLFDKQADLFTATQDPKNAEKAVNDKIAEIAKLSGANSDKVMACIKSGKYAQLVKDQTKEGTEFGIIGTPSLFVGTQFVGGAMDEANFTKLVEAQLNKK